MGDIAQRLLCVSPVWFCYGPEVGTVWSLLVVVGSVVCAVLVIASVAVGFSFLLVAILVAESMLLCAVYLARRALAPDEVALEKQSAGYVASVICLALLISSVALGLSFLVLPIVLSELLFLGAVYLVGQALSPDRVATEKQFAQHASTESAWYARSKAAEYARPVPAAYARPEPARSSRPGNRPAPTIPQLYKPYARRRATTSQRRQGEALTAIERNPANWTQSDASEALPEPNVAGSRPVVRFGRARPKPLTTG
jgi:hypothetical protein